MLPSHSNYSIALGLGFAGTVEVYVGGGDVLQGYRGAMYMGIGLSGIGVVLATVNKLIEVIRAAKSKKQPGDKAPQEAEK